MMDMISHQTEGVEFHGPVRISVKKSENQILEEKIPSPF